MLEHGPSSSSTSATDHLLRAFDHFSTSTLPGLWTLLFSSPAFSNFPPSNTSLIVIDSVSTVFSLAFPRTTPTDESSSPSSSSHQQRQQHSSSSRIFSPPRSVKIRNDAIHWASGRRWAVISDFVAGLAKLAALRNVAVLVINQTVARVRPDTGAMLLPAISYNTWESGIQNRILLYRDWTHHHYRRHPLRHGRQVTHDGGVHVNFSGSALPGSNAEVKEEGKEGGRGENWRNVRFAAVLKVGGRISRPGRHDSDRASPRAIAFFSDRVRLFFSFFSTKQFTILSASRLKNHDSFTSYSKPLFFFESKR